MASEGTALVLWRVFFCRGPMRFCQFIFWFRPRIQTDRILLFLHVHFWRRFRSSSQKSITIKICYFKKDNNGMQLGQLQKLFISRFMVKMFAFFRVLIGKFVY